MNKFDKSTQVRTAILFLSFFLSSYQLFSQTIDTLYTKSNRIKSMVGVKKIAEISERNRDTLKIKPFLEGNSGLTKCYIKQKQSNIWELKNKSGIKIEELTYNGTCLTNRKKWYSNGVLSFESNYKPNPEGIEYLPVFDGEYIENFESGLPKTKGSYVLNKKEGLWIEFSETGNKKSSITYKDGLESGKSTSCYKSGKIMSESNYVIIKNTTDEKADKLSKESNSNLVSVLNGVQTFYYENGFIKSKKNYKNGKLDGLSEEWSINEKKTSESYYKNDKINGIHREWYNDGVLKEEYTCKSVYDSIQKRYNQLYEGKYTKYKVNGDPKIITYYVNNKKHGTYTEFYDDVNIKQKEEQYDNGLNSGNFIRYSKSGDTLSLTQFSLVKVNDTIKSLKNGVEKNWYSKNQLQYVMYYENGLTQGLATRWYESGQKSSEDNYLNGLHIGKHISWNKDGSLKEEGEYIITNQESKQNLQNGIWKEYNENGKLLRFKQFKNGLLFLYEIYNEDGTLKSRTFYPDPKNGNYNGAYIETKYFSNGKISDECFYQNIKPIGMCSGFINGLELHYYINGNIKSVKNYNNGEIYGYSIEWLSDGSLLSFKNYKNYKNFEIINNAVLAKEFFDKYTNRPEPNGKLVNGKKEGLWVYWFDKEHKQFEMNFHDGILDSLFTAYYSNGKKMYEIEIRDGIKNGKYRTWYVNGNIKFNGIFVNGKVNGTTWSEYGESGNKILEIIYSKDDPKTLIQRKWYENGNPESENNYIKNFDTNGDSKTWYENGQLHSQWTCDSVAKSKKGVVYFKNGNKDYESQYINGKEQGEYWRWYENGNKSQLITYDNGKKNGKFLRWYEDGKPMLEGSYINDQEDGIWITYDKDGKLTKKTYSNGYKPYVPSQYCECIDSTKYKLNYAPMIKGLATLDVLRNWSFNFHAPIDEFYNNLFYINYQSSGGQNATFQSFKIIAFSPIYLKIPDENGIKMIFNPCKKITNSETRMQFRLNYNQDDKRSVKASLETNKIAIEFDPKLLHIWDKEQSKPALNDKNELMPSQILLTCEEVNYNADDHIQIDGIKDQCFSTSEIGNTGFLVDLQDVILDLDVTTNPDEINDSISNLWSSESPEQFVGAFTPKATFTMPKGFFNTQLLLQAEGQSLFVSNQSICGKLLFKTAQNPDKTFTTQISDGNNIVFSSDEFTKKLKEKGFTISKTEYNVRTKRFIVYFNYRLK